MFLSGLEPISGGMYGSLDGSHGRLIAASILIVCHVLVLCNLAVLVSLRGSVPCPYSLIRHNVAV